MSARGDLTEHSIVRRTTGVLEAEVDDEVVLLNIEKGNCYGLNKVGSRVWHLIAEPCRVADLCARLTAEYDIDAETCRQQVLELLEHLNSEDLITLSGGTGP
jgi:hypothetical protein